MNDQELREMVRASIARHAAGSPAGFPPPDSISGAHPSFVRLPLVRGGDADGACLIEPSVRCTHCGYCQSFGH
jgi:hypothetical protein